MITVGTICTSSQEWTLGKKGKTGSKRVKRRNSYLITLAGAVVACGAVAVWISVFTLDGLRDNILLFALGDDSQYVQGYSDRVFRDLPIDSPSEKILELLGEPWSKTYECATGGYIETQGTVVTSADESLQIPVQTETSVALKKCPIESQAWAYTLHKGNFRYRTLLIKNNRLVQKIAGGYFN